MTQLIQGPGQVSPGVDPEIQNPAPLPQPSVYGPGQTTRPAGTPMPTILAAQAPVEEPEVIRPPDMPEYASVLSNGNVLVPKAQQLNFLGTGVSITAQGSRANIAISQGGGGAYGNAEVAAYLPTYSGVVNTANITFVGNSKVDSLANTSGDGNGYTTLQLIPDSSLGTDQYLIVDPTAPNHIHLRAGGTQDASSAELYLGGEANHVRVVDGAGVYIKNDQTNSTVSNYNDPSGFTGATWTSQEGVYYVEYTQVDPELTPELTVNAINFGADPRDTLEVTNGTTAYVLTSAGSTNNPTPGVYQIRVNEVPPGVTPVALTAMTFTTYTVSFNEARLANNDFTVEVTDDIRITGGDIVTLRNISTTEPITIVADYDDTAKTWEFRTDGDMAFPDSTVQTTAWAGGRVVSAPTTSKGVSGDEAGDLAYDSSYTYYCTTDYTDGVSDIWRRVAWSNDTW